MNKIINQNNLLSLEKSIQYINSKLLNKPIIIVGMMGVGKSAIGRIVAKSLNRNFYDIDENIEKKYNMRIYEIFEKYGENKFRDIEHKEIKNIDKNSNIIIATGGGAFIYERNYNILNRIGLTIWLNAASSIIIERLKKNKNNRPLLKNEKIDTYINNLLEKRRPLYAKAHITINSQKISKTKMKNKILLTIEKYLMENKE